MLFGSMIVGFALAPVWEMLAGEGGSGGIGFLIFLADIAIVPCLMGGSMNRHFKKLRAWMDEQGVSKNVEVDLADLGKNPVKSPGVIRSSLGMFTRKGSERIYCAVCSKLLLHGTCPACGAKHCPNCGAFLDHPETGSCPACKRDTGFHETVKPSKESDGEGMNHGIS